MENTRNQQQVLLLCMAAVLAVPVYLYGFRPILMVLIAVVTAVLCDFVFNRWFHFVRRKKDLSSITAAAAIALMMPATVDYWVIVVAVFSGLLIAKYPFGGTGQNIFHPAALGMAVASLSFSDQVLRFPTPKTSLPLTAHIDSEQILFEVSPAKTMNIGGTPQIASLDLLLGNFAGAIGATCIIVLVIIMLFLLLQKQISTPLTGSFLMTVVLYAVLFPRVSTGRLDSVIFELTSGVLLFGIIFLASDRTTAPKNWMGQIVYGVSFALCTMIFRTVGALDVEFVFVMLVMNALSRECDRAGFALVKWARHKRKQIRQKAGETHA